MLGVREKTIIEDEINNYRFDCQGEIVLALTCLCNLLGYVVVVDDDELVHLVEYSQE